MKLFRGFQDRARGARRTWMRGSFSAVLGLMIVLAPVCALAAEQQAGPPDQSQAERARKESDKLDREIDKLKLENEPKKNAQESDKLSAEIDKLNFENSAKGRWIAPIVIPTGIALLGLLASVYGAWRTIQSEKEKTLAEIRAEFNQATHEKRLECYAELTKATSPLALFFPEYEFDRFRCLQIGSAMSQWYFTAGGLLLSSEARDEYFRLARAVTKAFHSDTLLAPAWEQYAKSISDKKMNEYREELGLSLEKEWDHQTKEKGRELAIRQIVRRGKRESSKSDKRRTSLCVQRLCSAANTQQSPSFSIGRRY